MAAGPPSISVYAFPFPAGIDESAPLNDVVADADEVTGENYGGLKVGCENVCARCSGAHANVRAGLIVGPHDPTGRFTYWPVRVARGGEVLAPGDPERAIQVVDARDLGAWLVHVAEQRIRATSTRPARPASRWAACSRHAAPCRARTRSSSG